MAKYTITYEVEALTLGDATSSAYEVLHLSGLMAHNVKVEPAKQRLIDVTTYSDAEPQWQTVPEPDGPSVNEGSSRVYEKVYGQRDTEDSGLYGYAIAPFTD